MTALKRVLIMAAGTGGHVFPGLAIADFLFSHGIEVYWLGTQSGLEARLLPDTPYAFHTIPMAGVRGKGLKTLLLAPFKIFTATRSATRIIRQIKPDIVIGMGGFVTVPGGLASVMQRFPLVIHEQNAIAGTANRLLLRFAKKVLMGFPNSFGDKPMGVDKFIELGNPIRQAIANVPPPAKRFGLGKPASRLNLLVLGGSLGAQVLNETVPQSLATIAESHRPHVIHQSGDKHFALTQAAYQSRGIDAEVKPFLEDMAAAYQWADLVICRAGALTVAELCHVGLGAIFIPYPYAIDDHQTANANYMVKHQAAICIDQKVLTPASLAQTLQTFINAPQQCVQMAHAAYALRKENVTEKFFNILQQLVKFKKERSVELDV